MKAKEYPGFFEQDILSKDTEDFENKFREFLGQDNCSTCYIVAGEVCFWKNYSRPSNSNNLTIRLLDHLSKPQNWSQFKNTLYNLEKDPTYENFCSFRDACNQPNGFAVPITYLSFLSPEKYPLADKWVAYWWREYVRSIGGTAFSQREDGWIQTTLETQVIQNWKAYLEWTDFCNNYAEKLSRQSGSHWRARDVEMAVFSAQKSGTALPPI